MPTRFNFLLEGNQAVIAELLQHIRQLHALDRALGSCIGLPASRHCHIANVTDDMLILHTDSSAWAAKLRYLTPQILEHMRKECNLNSIKSLRIQVRPEQTPPQSSGPNKPVMSSKTADFLKQAADTTSDEQLRLCYLRLARNKHS